MKLGVGASGTWEVTTWATAQRKDLRVAASIAYRVKAGDLKRWDTILRQEIRNTYHVSMHVVVGAIEILKDFGIFDNHGGRNVVACDDVDQAISESYSAGQLLNIIAHHVASIEDEVATLKQNIVARNLSADPATAPAAATPRLWRKPGYGDARPVPSLSYH